MMTGTIFLRMMRGKIDEDDEKIDILKQWHESRYFKEVYFRL